MSNGIKFTIHRPQANPENEKSTQVLSVSLQGPIFAFNLDPKASDYEMKLRTAKAELKMALIEEILKAPWENAE